MGKVVLRDGRVLELSSEQMERLSLVILLSTDMKKPVKVGAELFNLDDIVTDPEEVLRITQTKMFDVTPTLVQKKYKEIA